MVDSKGEIAGFRDGTDHWLPLSCTMNVAVVAEQMRELLDWDIPMMAERVDCQSDLECERVLWFCSV